MYPQPLTSDVLDWSRPSYKVRVRETPIYLWGSAGVTENLTFTKPLILHIHNDVFGEPITFGTQVASGTQTPYGSLQPGECVSIPLQDISGVFAACPSTPSTLVLESTVSCLIKEST
jgi:hypothetical protein